MGAVPGNVGAGRARPGAGWHTGTRGPHHGNVAEAWSAPPLPGVRWEEAVPALGEHGRGVPAVRPALPTGPRAVAGVLVHQHLPGPGAGDRDRAGWVPGLLPASA